MLKKFDPKIILPAIFFILYCVGSFRKSKSIETPPSFPFTEVRVRECQLRPTSLVEKPEEPPQIREEKAIQTDASTLPEIQHTAFQHPHLDSVKMIKPQAAELVVNKEESQHLQVHLTAQPLCAGFTSDDSPITISCSMSTGPGNLMPGVGSAQQNTASAPSTPSRGAPAGGSSLPTSPKTARSEKAAPPRNLEESPAASMPTPLITSASSSSALAATSEPLVPVETVTSDQSQNPQVSSKQKFFSWIEKQTRCCICSPTKDSPSPAPSYTSFECDPANIISKASNNPLSASQSSLASSSSIASSQSVLPVARIPTSENKLKIVSKSQLSGFEQAVTRICRRNKKTGKGFAYIQYRINRETNVVSIQGAVKNSKLAEAIIDAAYDAFGPNFDRNLEIEHLKSANNALLPRDEQPCALLAKPVHQNMTKHLDETSAIQLTTFEQSPKSVNEGQCKQYIAVLESKVPQNEIVFSAENTRKVVKKGFSLTTKSEELELKRLGLSNTDVVTRATHLQLHAYAHQSLDYLKKCCVWNGEKITMPPVNLEQWARHKNGVQVCLEGLQHLCGDPKYTSAVWNIMDMQNEILSRFIGIANNLPTYRLVPRNALRLYDYSKIGTSQPNLFLKAVRDSDFLLYRGKIRLDALIDLQGAEPNLFSPVPQNTFLVKEERNRLNKEQKNALHASLLEYYTASPSSSSSNARDERFL